jgi:hypothetical protein
VEEDAVAALARVDNAAEVGGAGATEAGVSATDDVSASNTACGVDMLLRDCVGFGFCLTNVRCVCGKSGILAQVF